MIQSVEHHPGPIRMLSSVLQLAETGLHDLFYSQHVRCRMKHLFPYLVPLASTTVCPLGQGFQSEDEPVSAFPSASALQCQINIHILAHRVGVVYVRWIICATRFWFLRASVTARFRGLRFSSVHTGLSMVRQRSRSENDWL
jgi:hypothetical protein